ncbi:MAG: hypothetical protein ABI792_06420 [bacterium]
MFYSCEIKQPAAPTWDVDLQLPFSNKSFNIFDILKRSGNIGYDSMKNNLVFLFGESKYVRSFGEDIKFDGLKTTEINAPSTFVLDTFIVVDDSTFVRRTEFLNGRFNFTFQNNSGKTYSVNATIKNLFNVSNGDTARISISVSAGGQKSIDFDLADYFIKNEIPDNRLELKLRFQSDAPVPVSFNYTLSDYSIKKIDGRLKPLSTGITTNEVIDPLGSDVPEGEVHFAKITPGRNFLILKKYSDLYQVDFSQISIVGENKNGNKVRLKYLKNGNSGDPVDSLFTLTLPSDKDSVAFPINENNSNILAFINNIPKKITATRTDILNLSYKEGEVTYTDSLTLNFTIQVPLDVNITEPIVFKDTVDAGITGDDQRKNLDDVKYLTFTFNTQNGFPLKATAKILILDSFFTPLIAISKIIGNASDSSITVNAASVGPDGFVNSVNTTSMNAELDSAEIQKLKHMGKIIYEYKLYTDQNFIPPPLNTVKIRGSDIIRELSFGKIKYRLNF